MFFDLIYYRRDRLVFALAAAFPPCRSGRGRYVLVFTTTRTRSISGLLSYIVPFLGSRFNIEREKFSNYLLFQPIKAAKQTTEEFFYYMDGSYTIFSH